MFPDPEGRHRAGIYRCEPDNGWLLFRGRKVLAHNLHLPGLGARLFQKLGSIFMFDQQRTGLSKRISPYELGLLKHLLDPEQAGEWSNGDDSADSGGRSSPETFVYGPTSDPRMILTSLAMRAQVAQDPEATERISFSRLKLLYERVCRPHKIGQLFNTDYGLDMEFLGDQGRYYYDGLSSGQQMILLMLLKFATQRIHRSIVLIDELELHLHPLWQDRLYTALTDLGDDNQYFFTTHSTHLRDTIGDKFYHATGELTDHAVPR